MNFGNALKTIRQFRKLSQEQASNLVHMDIRTLRRIETNATRLSAEQVVLFAEAYQVATSAIFELARDETSLNGLVHEGAVYPKSSL